MSVYEHRWQAPPSRLINHAMEHAKKNTDFDKLMAYLIIDVGVETIFKVFLEQYGFKELKKAKQKEAQNGGRELNFHTIIEIVKEVSGQKLQNVKIDDSNYFHDKRNKMYHQGADFPPNQEDLDGYLDLAKTLLKVLLDFDINKSQEPKLVETDHSLFSLERIRENIISLQSNSSLMVEHLYPQLATRKFSAQLKHIKEEYPDVEYSEVPFTEEEWHLNRIELFNEITGWELSIRDDQFVEYIIDNPEELHVWLALQELGNDDNWREDWERYKRAVYFVNHEQTKDSEIEDKRYEEIFKWTYIKAGVIIDLITKHIPNITIVSPAWYLDFE